jgi:hypothetical protein
MAPGRSPQPPDPELVRVAPPGGRRPWALVAGAAAIVLALSAWGLVGPVMEPDEPFLAAPATAEPPAPEPRAPEPRAVTRRGLAVIEGDGPGRSLVAARLGWAPCPTWSGLSWARWVEPAAVDAALDPPGGPGPGGDPDIGPEPDVLRRARELRGLVQVADRAGRRVSVWLGRDVREAVRGLGGRVLIQGSDGAPWTILPGDPAWEGSVGVRLGARTTPAGRMFWQIVDRAGHMPYCNPDEPARAVDPVELDVEQVEVLAGRRDGSHAIALREGWAECAVWVRYVTGGRPSARTIDRAASAAGRDHGWLDIPDEDRLLRIWLGSDPAGMAAAHGARAVATGSRPGSAWILLTVDSVEIAQQIARVETPQGRVAWLPTENAAGPMRPCGPADG